MRRGRIACQCLEQLRGALADPRCLVWIDLRQPQVLHLVCEHGFVLLGTGHHCRDIHHKERWYCLTRFRCIHGRIVTRRSARAHIEHRTVGDCFSASFTVDRLKRGQDTLLNRAHRGQERSRIKTHALLHPHLDVRTALFQRRIDELIAGVGKARDAKSSYRALRGRAVGRAIHPRIVGASRWHGRYGVRWVQQSSRQDPSGRKWLRVSLSGYR